MILISIFSPTASDLSHSFKVENIIVHPDFIPDHPSNQHDLAVIKIREEEINEKGEGETKRKVLWRQYKS